MKILIVLTSDDTFQASCYTADDVHYQVSYAFEDAFGKE